MRKQLFFLLKLTVTLGMIYWIIKSVDWNQALKELVSVPTSILLTAVLAIMLGWVVSAIKWQQLLIIHNRRFPLQRLTRWYGIAYFLSQFMPTGIGGDVYKIYKTFGKQADDNAVAVLSVFMERLTGLVTLVFMGASASIYLWIYHQDPLAENILLVAVPAGGCALIALYCIYQFNLSKKILNHPRCPKAISYLIKNFGAYKYHPAKSILVMLLSFFFHGIRVSMFTLITAVLSGKIMPLEITLVLTLLLLIALLPISIGGYGVVDGAFIYFMSVYGLEASIGITIMLLVRLAALPTALTGGLLYFVEDREKLRID